MLHPNVLHTIDDLLPEEVRETLAAGLPDNWEFLGERDAGQADDWILILRPRADVEHPGRMVHRVMKYALRQLGLECVAYGKVKQ